MGLGASAYNLLKYTRLKNDIGCQLMLLSTQKQALSRDMQKLSKKFQTEMNTKTLKWTTNGGYDYKDLSYSTLMSPGGLNNSKLHMITDMNGRVVVDSRYRQYAQMISQDGAPGGNYDDNTRNQILGALLGKDPDAIGEAFDAYRTYLDKKAELGESPKPEPGEYYDTRLNQLPGIDNFKSSNTNITSVSDLNNFVSSFSNAMRGYFPDEPGKFDDACQHIKDIWQDIDEDHSQTEAQIANQLIGQLEQTIGHWYPEGEYQRYQTALANWESENGGIEAEMTAAFNTYSGVFDSNTMAQADFYDKLFSSIAENGWRYYDNISDPDYLNNMFINGCFNITTVERDCTETSPGIYTYDNEYFTEPALNCDNIIQVNDKDHNNQVYIIYEAEKAKITAKEEKIDDRMERLKTEQSAIKEMIESVQNVMNTNVEKHFNIFG